MIDLARIHFLNALPPNSGRYVLYWMQAAQRAFSNAALEYALERSLVLRVPVVVCFGLMDDYPEANARHYLFMLEGLRDVAAGLATRGILFVIRHGHPADVAMRLSRDAAEVVVDAGYLRHQRQWRDRLARDSGRRLIEVEADVVVPVEAASDKLEFGARTLRPKISKLLGRFLVPTKDAPVTRPSLNLDIQSDIDVSNPAAALAKLKVDPSVSPSRMLQGGQVQGRARLKHFVEKLLPGYSEGRREPSVRGTSMMAAYLHFGQMSAIEIALAAKNAIEPARPRAGSGLPAPRTDVEAFLEELIVRRELAFNYVHYQTAYDKFSGLPKWAMATLAEHQKDARRFIYSRAELERATTHDPYWNAAQREMLATGYMHNMMRMYWGKKILEWKATAIEAFGDALYLNNKYFLCGRDPASYANVGWVFGLHDRPWAAREIFGTIRYMNDSGLRRKFDMDAYVKMVERMQA